MSVILLFVLLVSASTAWSAPEIGSPAPDFVLPGHDGKTYQLSQHRGKFVVLEWFNNECPYVGKHYDEDYRNMQGLQQTWIKKARDEGRELVWFSIISSAPGRQGYATAEEARVIRDEERRAKMDAILLDPEGKVGELYGAMTTPHMFIIDEKGILQYQGAIDDRPSSRVASLEGAHNYVSHALTSLMTGTAVAHASTNPYGCSVKYAGGW